MFRSHFLLALIASLPALAATAVPTPSHLPLVFETNRGQASDPAVKFLTRSRAAAVGLNAHGAVIALRRADGSSATVHMVLTGSREAAVIRGRDRQSTHVHYYSGTDPSKWLTDIPAWDRVQVSGAYPGIDLVWYGKDGELEHDFRVAPEADPALIRLRFEGTAGVHIDASGDLVLVLKGGNVRFRRPSLYQEFGGQQKEVAGGFRLQPDGDVGFEVGDYDRSRVLVIDPVIVYSTYIGGSGDDVSADVAVGALGGAVIVGVTASLDFPGRVNPNPNKLSALFVAKLNAAGDKLDAWSLFEAEVNGKSGGYLSSFIAPDYEVEPDHRSEGYAVGTTVSGLLSVPLTRFYGTVLFPTDPGMMVVFRLDADGKLKSSIGINAGGLEHATGVATDPLGNTYVTGESNSPDLPCTKRYGVPLTANDPKQIFVFKLDRNDNLSHSVCINGSANEQNAHIAADWQGNAYLTFETQSLDLPRTRLVGPEPTQGGGVQPCLIVAEKLDVDGNLLWSDWFNGSDDEYPAGIDVDLLGNAYIAAETHSIDFPLTRLFGTPLLQQAGIVHPCLTVAIKINSNGKPVYITGVNGSEMDQPVDIVVDLLGRPYIVGLTGSTDFPFTEQLGQPSQSINRIFVLRLNVLGGLRDAVGIAGGSLGAMPTGVGLDVFGRVYVGGFTDSPDFPVTPGSLGAKPFGGTDAFLMRLSNFAVQ